MKKIACCVLLVVGCQGSTPSETADSSYSYEAEMVKASHGTVIPVAKLNRAERLGRSGAVKVFTPGSGRGSGCYVTYKGAHLVITAAHVIDDATTNWLWVVRGDQKVKAHVVYFDGKEDIAVLATPPMEMATPSRLVIRAPYPKLGEELTYSGYPGHHDLLTIRGEVVGYEKISTDREKLVVHTYGWPGASGSCFFDKRGRMVGVLVAIPVGRGYVPQLLESMVFATPIKVLDVKKLNVHLCKLPEGVRPKRCKSPDGPVWRWSDFRK
jgi:hypothetical protein